MLAKVVLLAVSILVFALGACTRVAGVDDKSTYSPQFKEVDRILSDSCHSCHLYEFNSYSKTMVGRNGVVMVVPGDSAKSIIYQRITARDDKQMPIDKPLNAADTKTIKDWIDSGAHR